MTFSSRNHIVAAGCCVLCTLCPGSWGCVGKTSIHDSDTSNAAGASGVAGEAPAPAGGGGGGSGSGVVGGAGGSAAGTGGAGAAGGIGGTSEQAGGAGGSEAACNGGQATLVPCFPSPQDCDLAVRYGETRPGHPWYVLLEASSLGPEAKLVALDGNAVLAHVAQGVWQVVRLEGPVEPIPPYSEHLFSVWDLPDPALEAIDVADPFGSGIWPGLLVLACAEGDCKLFGAPDGEAPSAPVLTELSLPALPGSFDPSGLAVSAFRNPEQEELCVFGNGMVCLADGAWQTVIPSQAGVQIIDALFGDVSVAIGTGGHWYKREADAQWVEQAPLPAELDFGGTLLQGRYEQPVIVGDGRLWKVEPSCAAECSLEQPIEAALGRDLVQADGQSLFKFDNPPEWCEDWSLNLGEPLLDASRAPCADSDNPRVLAAARVMGQDACVYRN